MYMYIYICIYIICIYNILYSVQNNSRSSVNFRLFHANDHANCLLVGLTVRSYP